VQNFAYSGRGRAGQDVGRTRRPTPVDCQPCGAQTVDQIFVTRIADRRRKRQRSRKAVVTAQGQEGLGRQTWRLFTRHFGDDRRQECPASSVWTSSQQERTRTSGRSHRQNARRCEGERTSRTPRQHQRTFDPMFTKQWSPRRGRRHPGHHSQTRRPTSRKAVNTVR